MGRRRWTRCWGAWGRGERVTVCRRGDICDSSQSLVSVWRSWRKLRRRDEGCSGDAGNLETQPAGAWRGGGSYVYRWSRASAKRNGRCRAILWATPCVQERKVRVHLCSVWKPYRAWEKQEINRRAIQLAVCPLPLPWFSQNTHRRPRGPSDVRGRSTVPDLEAAVAPSAHSAPSAPSAPIPNPSFLSPANPHHARSPHPNRIPPRHPRHPRPPRPRRLPRQPAHAGCLSDP